MHSIVPFLFKASKDSSHEPLLYVIPLPVTSALTAVTNDNSIFVYGCAGNGALVRFYDIAEKLNKTKIERDRIVYDMQTEITDLLMI